MAGANNSLFYDLMVGSDAETHPESYDVINQAYSPKGFMPVIINSSDAVNSYGPFTG